MAKLAFRRSPRREPSSLVLRIESPKDERCTKTSRRELSSSLSLLVGFGIVLDIFHLRAAYFQRARVTRGAFSFASYTF